MAYSTSSKFIQVTPYLLMEYMYADQPQPESYFTNSGGITVGYEKLINGYRSNFAQIFNPEEDYPITHNSAENSVVQIGENSFVTLDSNLIVPFNDFSDELTSTADLPVVFPSNLLVIYDSVRYHIRAGYNLGNIDGLIMQIEYQDQNLTYVTISQILIQKGTNQQYELNPNPITIGSNIYDKYFEIKIPNQLDMNNKYLAASSTFKPQTLAALISQSGTGFVFGAPIRISCWQVQSINDFNGYLRYNSSKIATLSLEQEDPFSNIGATIKESDSGQFFEYYATDNEGFVEDFILFQNSLGNSYYISHEIEVLEQIGAALIQTSGFQSIQTTAYDLPNYYRPIVRNAGVAVSFTLRYTMSLINSINQSRVIRIASYTSTNPSQWGTTITPIQLSTFPQVMKIYNRVYDQPQIKIGSSGVPQPKEIVKYTNVFIDQNFVTATFNNLNFVNNSLTASTEGQTETIAYGTGKLVISISPFDNYFKFKFVKNGPDNDPQPIDLSSSGQFYISFIDAAGNKIQVPALVDRNLANPATGEVAFKIDESIAVKVLQLTDRRFFITNGLSVTPATAVATGNAAVSVAAGTSDNVIEKRLEDVVATRKAAAITADGLQNSVIVAASNILTPLNNASSVIYWGYWKKEGEVFTIPGETPGATAAPAPKRQFPLIETSGFIGDVIEVPAEPVLKGINPVSSTSGFQNIGVPAVSVPFSSLTGDALVAAVAAEISGYKALGWTDQDIVSFFLDPGRPGSQKYPNLTIELLIRAAEGLLSQLEIANLRRLAIRQSSASGGYFGGSSQYLYLDGREIPKENIE
jgi:hypothetical protein